MKIGELTELAGSLEGVRSRTKEGCTEWRYRGRLIARLLDERFVVIRCDFDYRDWLLRASPRTFSVPPRYRKHMMIVADLVQGDPGAIEDAVEAAWILQRRRTT